MLMETDGNGGTGTLDARGGVKSEDEGGDGGAGRLRVDGVPQGIADFSDYNVPSLATTGAPTEFVGPALTWIR